MVHWPSCCCLLFMRRSCSSVYARPIIACTSSSACSLSFSFFFCLISLGKYIFIKFCIGTSRFRAQACWTAVGWRHNGQSSICFFCALIRHRTQNTCPHTRRIGRQAIDMQTGHTEDKKVNIKYRRLCSVRKLTVIIGLRYNSSDFGKHSCTEDISKLRAKYVFVPYKARKCRTSTFYKSLVPWIFQ